MTRRGGPVPAHLLRRRAAGNKINAPADTPVVINRPKHFDAARGRYASFDLEYLHCYGCAHSTATAPWPGHPSGEKPCGFCVRNPQHTLSDPASHEWFDYSKPISVPMDCYETIDMRQQVAEWLDRAEHAGADALEKLLELQRRLSE